MSSDIGQVYREFCVTCLSPLMRCYCAQIKRFDPKIKFVILMHPIEFRRRIATGRMAYLTLKNSELIVGHDYSNHSRVNEMIADRNNHCVVLYPGQNAFNISHASEEEKESYFQTQKTLVVFVIDGTWHTARKTMHLSQNLKRLPQVCFTPLQESQFRVRLQPKKYCLSTIEAIHHTIELIATRYGFDVASDQQGNLLDVFDSVVEKQLHYIEVSMSQKIESRHTRRL